MAFFRTIPIPARWRAATKSAPKRRRSRVSAAEALEVRLALAADVAPAVDAGVLAPPPLAVDDLAAAPRDTAIVIDVLANDESDPSGLALSVQSVTQPLFGTASIVTETVGGGLEPVGVNQPPFIISEIKLGEFIEFFNTTGTAINLGTVPHWLSSRPISNSLAALGNGITLPANGYAHILWPANFTDADAGGEIVLYRSNANFDDGSLIEDFVAWGTNPHQSRLALASSVGKWSDDPAAALTQGSLQRRVQSDGISAASYDTASTSTLDAGPAGSVQMVDRIRYVPAAGFAGADFFSYTAEDENGETETARVRVDVTTVAVERTLDLGAVTQAAGRMVSLPIELNETEGVVQIDIALHYNTTFIDLANASVRSGGANASWSVAANVDDAAGTASFTLSALTPLAAGSGSVAILDIFVEEFAAAGNSVDLIVDSAQLNGGLLPADSSNGSVGFNARTLIVENTVVGANTITMTFNDEINPALLNLYDGQDAPIETADLTLFGAATGAVQGSLYWNLGLQELHFVKTSGIFAPDNYTLTLKSAPDGIIDFNDALLDGNDDGVAGGNFVHAFSVSQSSSRLLSVPHITRGPAQDIALNGTAGIPLTLSDGSDVLSLDFLLLFDPALFELADIARTDALPDDWTVAFNEIPGTGIASVVASGSTALDAGEIVPLLITGRAPSGMLRGRTGLLEIFDPQLNEGGLEVASQNGFQTVAFFGDVTGDGSYSALDAAYIARLGVRLENGLDAYPMTDPHLIGDITGDGTISSLDASLVARKAVGLPQAFIPELPMPMPAPAPPVANEATSETTAAARLAADDAAVQLDRWAVESLVVGRTDRSTEDQSSSELFAQQSARQPISHPASRGSNANGGPAFREQSIQPDDWADAGVQREQPTGLESANSNRDTIFAEISGNMFDRWPQ